MNPDHDNMNPDHDKGKKEEAGWGHRIWLRLNLALMLLLIVAFAVQISAIRGCTAKALRACEGSGGVRQVQTVGFGPFMSCTYECQQRQHLARSTPHGPAEAMAVFSSRLSSP